VRRPLAVGLFVTLASRLAAAALVRLAPAWDGYFYARHAEQLAAGLGYVSADGAGTLRPTAFYPVGYPAAMAALLPLTHSARLAAIGVNLVASLVAVAAVVLVADRAAGPRVATVAGLVYALYPGSLLWSAAAMTETLTGALLVVAMAAAGSSRRGSSALAGLALGAAALVRPQSLVALPLVALGARSWRGRLGAVALAALVALSVVAPWTVRNCARLDACALVSTNGGSNLLIGTFADARGGYRRPRGADGCATARGEVERDRCMSRVAVARIVEHPLRWASLVPMKLALTFGIEHDPASYAFGDGVGYALPWGTSLVAMLTAAWWALVAFAWRARSLGAARDAGRFCAGACGLSAMTHAVFLGTDRYHLTLVPVLAPVAAMGLVAWRDARGARVV
jgi:4-amino-4-deoxy-L-arabinose transferase-like glycosyltransferase